MEFHFLKNKLGLHYRVLPTLELPKQTSLVQTVMILMLQPFLVIIAIF